MSIGNATRGDAYRNEDLRLEIKVDKVNINCRILPRPAAEYVVAWNERGIKRYPEESSSCCQVILFAPGVSLLHRFRMKMITSSNLAIEVSRSLGKSLAKCLAMSALTSS